MLSISSMRTSLKKRAVKMLVLVVLLYLVCWSPLQVFTLTMRESESIKASSVVGLKYYLECLAFSSTAYNPIVYAFLNQTFRNNLRAVFLRKKRRVAPLSVQPDGLAPVFKTASSNWEGTDRTQPGSKTENGQTSKRTRTTAI
ncbi:pyroglutamylated rfamide peptide receptor [Plakobranchus ocellatus]|uniref:Pyroglutamylated rfamide peptide receptor n=1 Tax=Plakobranchus ocellatus TaxID=259542 RepID=A0AAV4D2U2_9GAST|nr:pyroglutamylated rfamide peptide receptor [Plakobranchus ocellatus]